MDHVAIDIGGKESQICVRTEDGTILEEARCATTSLNKVLAKRAKSRVVMETCAEAFGIASAAMSLGHEVVVVPAMLVRSLGVGHRGLKNDVRDARNLSEASCRMAKLPSVHVPTEASRDRKSACGMREVLVAARTATINSVRGWLRGTAAGRPRTGGAESMPRRTREALAKRETVVPSFVERQLQAIDDLSKQIVAADKELAVMAKADEVCCRLMTVPGVGPVVSLRFASALDEVGRFANAHLVESYLGLTPGDDSSSGTTRSTSITKAGSSRTRWALVQAAWIFRRVAAKHPAAQWAEAVERRRGKGIAIVALARKLTGILYAIWRDGSTYDPNHIARPSTT